MLFNGVRHLEGHHGNLLKHVILNRELPQTPCYIREDKLMSHHVAGDKRESDGDGMVMAITHFFLRFVDALMFTLILHHHFDCSCLGHVVNHF